MTATSRTTLSIAAALVAATLTMTLAGAQAQNQDGRGPRAGRGRGPQDGPGGFGRFGGPGRGGPGGPMAQLGPIMRLDLTEAQRAQVRSLVESRQAETKATMDRGRAVREALHAAVTSDTFDEGTVRARHADVAAVEAEMAVARARLHADVLQILTPEQRAQLKEWQAQRGKRDSR